MWDVPGQSFPTEYQECKKNETEKQKEDQKAQNLKQLSIEIYKAKEYIDQHLADKLTLEPGCGNCMFKS
ncbi:MAG: hypothetical protein ACLURP_04240 [Ruminococcus sp.]